MFFVGLHPWSCGLMVVSLTTGRPWRVFVEVVVVVVVVVVVSVVVANASVVGAQSLPCKT